MKQILLHNARCLQSATYPDYFKSSACNFAEKPIFWKAVIG